MNKPTLMPELKTGENLKHPPISPVSETRKVEGLHLRVLGRGDRLTPEGLPCTRLLLGNLAGTCRSVIYHDRISAIEKSLQHGDIVIVDGELWSVEGTTYLRPRFTRVPETRNIKPTALLPREWVLPAFLPQLKLVMRHWCLIENTFLREFLAQVFQDASNALGFLNVHGSLRHHHSYQGGLLDHTAEMLKQFGEEHPSPNSNLERDIVTTLILIHDIGKTVTLVGNHRGAVQPHDMAALELLAQPLVQLETKSPVLSNIIRGYYKPRNWQPRYDHSAYNTVSDLDRKSAGMLVLPPGVSKGRLSK